MELWGGYSTFTASVGALRLSEPNEKYLICKRGIFVFFDVQLEVVLTHYSGAFYHVKRYGRTVK